MRMADEMIAVDRLIDFQRGESLAEGSAGLEPCEFTICSRPGEWRRRDSRG